MRIFTAFLGLITASYSQYGPPPADPAPPQELLSFDCKNRENGNYANGCSPNYVSCVAGFAYPFVCPAGLVFDAAQDKCDYPDSCGKAREDPTTTTTAAYVTTQKPTAATRPAYTTARVPVYQPTEDLDLVDCSMLSDGFYSNGCSATYTVCSYGTASPVKCPAGLLFDQRTSSCEYPDQCGRVPPSTTQGYAPSQPAYTTAKPAAPANDNQFDCSQLSDGFYSEGCSATYTVCSHGTARSVNCPAGLVFDQSTTSCQYPDQCGRTPAAPTQGYAPSSTQPVYTTAQPPATPSTDNQIDCSQLSDGFYSNGCSATYTVCSHGTARSANCPAGLVFDQAKTSCQYPDQCGQAVPSTTQGYVPSTAAPASPTDPSTPFSCVGKDDGDYSIGCVNEYIQCANGNAYPRNCPAGLLFDVSTAHCDYACTSVVTTTTPVAPTYVPTLPTTTPTSDISSTLPTTTTRAPYVPPVVVPSTTSAPTTTGPSQTACTAGDTSAVGDCSSKFHRCRFGQWVTALCPSVTVFDESIGLCVYDLPRCNTIFVTKPGKGKYGKPSYGSTPAVTQAPGYGSQVVTYPVAYGQPNYISNPFFVPRRGHSHRRRHHKKHGKHHKYHRGGYKAHQGRLPYDSRPVETHDRSVPVFDSFSGRHNRYFYGSQAGVFPRAPKKSHKHYPKSESVESQESNNVPWGGNPPHFVFEDPSSEEAAETAVAEAEVAETSAVTETAEVSSVDAEAKTETAAETVVADEAETTTTTEVTTTSEEAAAETTTTVEAETTVATTTTTTEEEEVTETAEAETTETEVEAETEAAVAAETETAESAAGTAEVEPTTTTTEATTTTDTTTTVTEEVTEPVDAVTETTEETTTTVAADVTDEPTSEGAAMEVDETAVDEDEYSTEVPDENVSRKRRQSEVTGEGMVRRKRSYGASSGDVPSDSLCSTVEGGTLVSLGFCRQDFVYCNNYNKKVLAACPVGELFDSSTNRCVNALSCGETSVPAAQAPSSELLTQPSEPATQQTSSSSSSSYVNRVNQDMGHVTSCQDRVNGPISLGCSANYLMCSNSIAIEMKCPEGLMFNEERSICDLRDHVPACGGTSADQSGSATQQDTSSSSYVNIPLSKDVHHFDSCEGRVNGPMALGCSSNYVVCSNNVAVELKCPEGLMFDEERSVCDLKQTIPACGPTTADVVHVLPTAAPRPYKPVAAPRDKATSLVGSNAACSSLVDGFYSSSACSSSYVHCQNGAAVATMNCPSNLFYHSERMQCLHKEEVPTCGSASTVPAESPEEVRPYRPEIPVPDVSSTTAPPASSNKVEPAADSKICASGASAIADCSPKYTVCSNGVDHVMSCAAPLVFSRSSRSCEYREFVSECRPSSSNNSVKPSAYSQQQGESVVTSTAASQPFKQCAYDKESPYMAVGYCVKVYSVCGENGILLDAECAVGHLFDAAEGKCVSAATCGQLRQQQEQVKASPSKEVQSDSRCSGKAENELVPMGKCHSAYVRCSSGVAANEMCADNFVFSARKGRCVSRRHSSECSSANRIGYIPISSDASFFCQGRPDGLYKDPKKCDGILQCFGGDMFVHSGCTSGLVFNEATGQCDYRQNVPGCEQANDDPKMESGCRGAPHGAYLPHDSDCSVFFRCVWDRLERMNCPTGTVFNPTLSVCDWPSAVPSCAAGHSQLTTTSQDEAAPKSPY